MSREAPPVGAPRSRRIALARLGLFATALAVAFVIVATSGLRPSVEGVREWGGGLGPLGPLLFVPLAAALNCVFVPNVVLAGGAGLLFGTALGGSVALAAWVLGAVAQFLLARHLAGRHVNAILPDRVRRLDDFLERHGFLAVLCVRLTPGMPWVMLNYGAGLSRLRLRDLAAGTALGAAPRCFLYTALGGSLSTLGATEATVAVALLVATAAVGLFFLRRQFAADRP